MFESVLARPAVFEPRSAAGAALLVTAHALAVAGVLHLSRRGHGETRKKPAPEVVYYHALPALPPPPPLGGAAHAAKVEAPRKPVIVKGPDRFFASTPKLEEPPPKPEQDRPEAAPPAGGGEKDGAPGGVSGGVRGGDPRVTIGDTAAPVVPPKEVVYAMRDGMVRPTRIAGQDPVYTREAREARVEGVALVKCVLRVSGALEACRIIKGVPLMDEAILSALGTYRFTPVLFEGRPVSVEYLLTIRLKLE